MLKGFPLDTVLNQRAHPNKRQRTITPTETEQGSSLDDLVPLILGYFLNKVNLSPKNKLPAPAQLPWADYVGGKNTFVERLKPVPKERP